MQTNAEVINRFYTAFQQKDYQGMNACYSDDIVFSDPAFGLLRGEEAKYMWEMLCKNAKDFSLRAIRDEALELGGNAILGVEFSYHALGTHNDMMILLVSTRGTAVLLSA